jgi:hypothetical protein
VGPVKMAQLLSFRVAPRCDDANNNGLQPPRASETRRTPRESNLLAKLAAMAAACESPKMTPIGPSKQTSENPT